MDKMGLFIHLELNNAVLYFLTLTWINKRHVISGIAIEKKSHLFLGLLLALVQLLVLQLPLAQLPLQTLDALTHSQLIPGRAGRISISGCVVKNLWVSQNVWLDDGDGIDLMLTVFRVGVHRCLPRVHFLQGIYE